MSSAIGSTTSAEGAQSFSSRPGGITVRHALPRFPGEPLGVGRAQANDLGRDLGNGGRLPHFGSHRVTNDEETRDDDQGASRGSLQSSLAFPQFEVRTSKFEVQVAGSLSDLFYTPAVRGAPASGRDRAGGRSGFGPEDDRARRPAAQRAERANDTREVPIVARRPGESIGGANWRRQQAARDEPIRPRERSAEKPERRREHGRRQFVRHVADERRPTRARTRRSQHVGPRPRNIGRDARQARLAPSIESQWAIALAGIQRRDDSRAYRKKNRSERRVHPEHEVRVLGRQARPADTARATLSACRGPDVWTRATPRNGGASFVGIAELARASRGRRGAGGAPRPSARRETRCVRRRPSR